MVEWIRGVEDAGPSGLNVACNMPESTLGRIKSKHHAGAPGLSPPAPLVLVTAIIVASSVKWPPPTSASAENRRKLHHVSHNATAVAGRRRHMFTSAALWTHFTFVRKVNLLISHSNSLT
jgi:hypothetical protein